MCKTLLYIILEEGVNDFFCSLRSVRKKMCVLLLLFYMHLKCKINKKKTFQNTYFMLTFCIFFTIKKNTILVAETRLKLNPPSPSLADMSAIFFIDSYPKNLTDGQILHRLVWRIDCIIMFCFRWDMDITWKPVFMGGLTVAAGQTKNETLMV